MDRLKFTTIAHANCRYLGPVFESKALHLIDRMSLHDGAQVLDIGCGKGAVLALAERHYRITGTGVDINEHHLDFASSNAPGCNFRAVNAQTLQFELGQFDAAICTGATDALGGLEGTLNNFKNWVKPGGRVLIAEGFWASKPSKAYLEFLGGQEDEIFDLPGTLRLVETLGWQEVYSATSSQDEWDHYEGSYLSGVIDHISQHPDDPDNHEMLNRIRAWRDMYLQHGRGTLGLVWMVLRNADRELE